MSKDEQVKFHLKALLIDLAVRLVARLTHRDRLDIWALLDEFARAQNIELIQQIVLKSPDILAKRIEREVDQAIVGYNGSTTEEETPEPVWIDDADGDTILGGTLGFTYDFVVDLEDNKED